MPKADKEIRMPRPGEAPDTSAPKAAGRYTPGKTYQDDYYEHTMTGRVVKKVIKKIAGE